ncbi:MAG: LuxR C-terminal-related transcriptional regulator [Bacteroidia bacterium]
MKTTNILIADNAFLVREGIKAVVADSKSIHVIGEARNEKELHLNVSQHKPDVVIIDYRAGKAFSTDSVRDLIERSPSTNVLVISSDLERRQVISVLEYGVLGFLLKECDEEEILGAIKAVAAGEKFFCSKVLDILLERTMNPAVADCAPTRLTQREIEVVKQMAEGVPAQEIAERLSLSVHTVYTHRKNIMRKLGASSASEVIRYAFQTALVKAN